MVYLAVERRGTAAWITTERRVDTAMAAELQALCDKLAGDGDVRSVVLTGRGDAFGESGEELMAGDPFGCLADLPKPVICAINGAATGAGLALALAADIRIAATGAAFSLPEAAAGRLPPAGAIQRLARLAGRGKALEMILLGAAIDAEEALRAGLVSEVVAAEGLAGRAQEIADRVAERGPLALQFAKEAVSRGIDMTLEQALRFETDLTIILQTTEDRAEGVKAFLDRRRPEFKGK